MAILIDILATGVIDSSGEPLDSGLVYVYQVGTTTKVNVYSDNDLTTPVSNPVTLSAAGKSEVYVAQKVRLVITTSLGVTVDDIESVGEETSDDEFTDDVLPATDSSFDLGSSTRRWEELHVNDLYVYDDAFIEFLSRTGAANPEWINNMSLLLQAGTISVGGWDGTVLSATNPAYVAVPGTTAGRNVILKVTAGGSFNDDSHASSSLTNLGFGVTETADWAQDVPFFLYVVNKSDSNIDGVDGSSAFFISRSPSMRTTPSSANDIGDTSGIPSNDSQNVILLLGTFTQANYISLPCRVIGGFRMQWVTSTDDWTVQALGDKDGIGEDALDALLTTQWTYPAGQNGAVATKYLLANAGTAPVFNVNVYVYKLHRDGSCTVAISLTADGGTDGAGAVRAQVTLPYVNALATSIDHAMFRKVSATGGTAFVLARPTASAVYFEMRETDGTFEQNDDFTNGDREIIGTLTYWPF